MSTGLRFLSARSIRHHQGVRGGVVVVGAAFMCFLLVQRLARGQTTQVAQTPMDFGAQWIHFPPGERLNKTSPRTVELLGQAMATEPTAERRAQLATDLGSCALPEAAPFLTQALKDSDEVVRASAARAAGRLGDKQMLAPLRSAVADHSSLVRTEVVRAAHALGDAQLVTQGLTDAAEEVFAASCYCASTSEQAGIIGRRLQLGAGTTPLSMDSRLSAIAALGNLKESARSGDVVPFLHASIPEQIAALAALSEMKAVGSVDAIAALLKSVHPTVRRSAELPLLQLAPVDIRRAIGQQMLRDADATVRTAAAKLLASAPDDSAIPMLVAQLSDDDIALHDAAIDALIATRAENAGVKLLDDVDPRRREDGSYLLGQLKTTAGFDRHVALLTDHDWNVVAQAARSLGSIGRSDAAAQLASVVHHLKNLSETVAVEERNDASLAFGDALVAAIKLGNSSAFDDARPLIAQKDAPSYARGAAIWAFGALGHADQGTCKRLIQIINDDQEDTNAKFEAVKALGNLRYKPAAETLQTVEQNAADMDLWIAHAALDRINGISTPFVPVPVEWRADVSITDLTDQ